MKICHSPETVLSSLFLDNKKGAVFIVVTVYGLRCLCNALGCAVARLYELAIAKQGIGIKYGQTEGQ